MISSQFLKEQLYIQYTVFVIRLLNMFSQHRSRVFINSIIVHKFSEVLYLSQSAEQQQKLWIKLTKAILKPTWISFFFFNQQLASNESSYLSKIRWEVLEVISNLTPTSNLKSVVYY